MQVKMISDDGWIICAPTLAEAHATATHMLIDTVEGFTLEDAEVLIEHDIDRGIIIIVGEGYHHVN